MALRYEGAERRRGSAEPRGVERRRQDPSTEQDHPQLFELQ
jgi:hypothetical protein